MERREIGKKPISSEKPTGTSVRYEPEFEELQGEIDKLVSISGGIPDWGKVAKLSEEILKEKSKDLLVASYLCGGLLETEGLSGLYDGLTVFKDLLANFWEQLFPPLKRKRGRIGAVAWLAERLEKVLERREPSEAEGEAARYCRETLDEIDKLLLEYLGDDAPTMQRVVRILRRWPEPAAEEEKEKVEEAKEPEKEEVKTEKKSSTAQGTVISVEEISSDSDFHRILRQTLVVLRRLAGYVFNQDKKNPLGYRLLRQGVWTEISGLPPHQNKKTRLPYPGQIKDRLDKMMTEGRWDDLLVQAESLLPERPLWLDLQRYSAMALSNLGNDYALARDSVVVEFAGFLKRMKGIEDLLFSSGEPFADIETRSWIQNEVCMSDKEVVATQDQEETVNQEKDDGVDLWKQINEMKTRGEINGALSLLREHLWHASSEREAFCRRLELAQFCIDAGLFEVAVPHLRFLEEKIRSYHVDSWEPSLAIPALVALYRCEKTLASRKRQVNPDLGRKLEEIYASICKLDPAEALSLKE